MAPHTSAMLNINFHVKVGCKGQNAYQDFSGRVWWLNSLEGQGPLIRPWIRAWDPPV